VTSAATGTVAPLVQVHEIHANDSLFVMVTTSQRATLYLAYCDVGQQLSIYPPTGELVAEPNTPTRIPRGDSFIADGRTGEEHLYVIASSAPLDRGDPRLFELVHSAQGVTVACPPEVAEPAPPEPEPAPAPTPAPAARKVARGSSIEVASATHRIAPRLIARGFAVGGETTSPTRTGHSDPSGIAIFPISLSHK